MVGEENNTTTTNSNNPSGVPPVSGRRTFWRSASWSASRTLDPNQSEDDKCQQSNNPSRRCPAQPLTPRSLSVKNRSCLPPLQPLFIAKPSLDEWPKAGSDDLGEWPNNPPTPGASTNGGPPRGGDGLRLDLSTIRPSHGGKKEQIAFFDKECSKVADHIYLGGDSVAKNREILRKNGITHVLNCVGFVCPEYFKTDLIYKTLWLQDSPSEDITSILYDVFDYFEDVREQNGRVFVHCCQGVSRSTSLVIAYLMWRKGQSFDDAFEYVKAARGIANPNMGFACQLLQCQKRVHAIPLSPNSVLRMYRMAPHSPYDPLHLVPKMLNEPALNALDSRGAFIVHFLSSIYVWIGKNCNPNMANDAKTAAFQVVRYEKVQGSFIVVQEGEEPDEFWEAFSSPKPSLNPKNHVDSYDSDFEVFHKAISGGVVPAFSLPGLTGQQPETRLPARESDWSVLRRKFIPKTLLRTYSDSALVRDANNNMNNNSGVIAISPPFLSPSSFSSDSSISSKYSSDSPTISPSTSSPPSLIPSPIYNNNINNNKDQEVNNNNNNCSPLRSSSIAERRGGFSPLKLVTLSKASNSKGISVNSNQSEKNLTFDKKNEMETAVYKWPEMEKLESFSKEDFDAKSVLVCVVCNKSKSEGAERKVCLFIGRDFDRAEKETELNANFDWSKVARDFLDSMGFPSDLPIEVLNETRKESLMELLNS
ncbi:hypothetical protein LUZ60_004060 [Juncus effusus]|nr:hypothetical protein LUZ60_004060 [Juncus effusus]